jgi:superoxide dismutase, Fe-Mn family
MNPSADIEFRAPGSTPQRHQLPQLEYHYSALEPYIDSRTLKLHHDIHHWAYVENLNTILERFPGLGDYSALWLSQNLDRVPDAIREAVRHNAGGHVNHSMHWRAMKPDAAGEPCGPLYDAINRDFGSVADFKTRFEDAGAGVAGCGWVWLSASGQNRKLEVITTSDHDYPAARQGFPLLLNDVWEHAYYLNYESRRRDYLKAWWAVVDWDEASRRFNIADNSVGGLGDVQGKLFLVV